MNILKCPVCDESIWIDKNRYLCKSGHSFDIAKEGYVNLLDGGHRAGNLIGDNKNMAYSRQSFLNKGYFDALTNQLKQCFENIGLDNACVLDICCGEGYYSSVLSQKLPYHFFGFDISKEMVRLAAKKKSPVTYFVANMAHLPISDSSVDIAFHLFAPFHNSEFSRVLKDGGYLFSVIPGRRHLFELKQIMYENPYENDEQPPAAENFTLVDTIHVSDTITLDNSEDIMSLLKMTPYFYHTSDEGKAHLAAQPSLATGIEFVVLIYKNHK